MILQQELIFSIFDEMKLVQILQKLIAIKKIQPTNFNNLLKILQESATEHRSACVRNGPPLILVNFVRENNNGKDGILLHSVAMGYGVLQIGLGTSIKFRSNWIIVPQKYTFTSNNPQFLFFIFDLIPMVISRLKQVRFCILKCRNFMIFSDKNSR